MSESVVLKFGTGFGGAHLAFSPLFQRPSAIWTNHYSVLARPGGEGLGEAPIDRRGLVQSQEISDLKKISDLQEERSRRLPGVELEVQS